MKNKIKGILSVFLMATVLSSSVHVLNPPRSEAILIVALAGNLDRLPNGNAILILGLGCIVFWPLCLFEEDASEANQFFSHQDLLDNGYSQFEADQILVDQTKLLETLKTQEIRIEIQSNETFESLDSGLRELVPDLSEVFVQFVADNAGIQ